MTCQTLHRWLLEAEPRRRMPAELRAHVADCPRCQRLQHYLRRIEQNLALVPVPPTTARSAFLREFLAPAGPPIVAAPVVAPPPARSWRYLAAVAAAVLVLIGSGVIFYALRPDAETVAPAPVARRPQLLDNLLERDLRLAQATTQRERVEALADLADDLHGETQFLTLEANPTDLDTLARLYAQVVREGIVPRARDLPAAQRRSVLVRIAERLLETASAADRRSKEAPAYAAVLNTIAIASSSRSSSAAALTWPARRPTIRFNEPCSATVWPKTWPRSSKRPSRSVTMCGSSF
jgi:hypothetical protein